MEEEIKVLQISRRYLPHFSGPSFQAQKINEQLLSGNITVNVITQKENNEKDFVNDIKVMRFPKLGLKKYYDTKIGLLIWAILTAKYLIKKRNEYQVIHVLDSFSTSIIFSITAALLKKPIILKNSINGVYKNNSIIKKIKFFILKKNAYVVAISEETKKEALQCGFRSERVMSVPNGVNTNIFEKSSSNTKNILRHKHKINDSAYVGLYTGSVNGRKGVAEVVNAWSEVVKEDKQSLLLIVGPTSDQMYLAKLKGIIKELNLLDNVFILGNNTEIHEFYKLADIYLFGSYREGLPNSIMEAMASELPICARKIPGVIDLLDESSGILIESDINFSKNLSNKILFLKNKNSIAKELGEKSREKIIKHYSLDKTVEQYQELYSNLVYKK